MSENDSIVMQQDNAKGSTALQAKIVNVYPNGITEEKCREICMDVYKDNIMSLQKEAKDIAFQRAERLTDMFIKKLSEQNENIRNKIEKQLKDPSMQEAIFKSQKCYAMSNDEDHLKILTDMLIDRGSISQRTNKQMLIDEAIDVLPRLNQKHLDILLFYCAIMLSPISPNKEDTTEHINDLIKYLQVIIPIKKNDPSFHYLVQKSCLMMFTGGSKLKKISEFLAEHFEILHSGFPKNDYDSLVTVDIPEIPFASSLIKAENVIISTSLSELRKILDDKDLSEEDYYNIIHFWHRNKGENDLHLIENYIINNFENGNILFENWSKINRYSPTILGMIIAQAYLRIKYQCNAIWDFD